MHRPDLTRRNEVFQQTVETDVVRSRYDLSERSVGSFRMGCLYPIYCRNDVLPGDRFSMSCAPFIRLLPMVSPSLTSIDVEVRFFFVPRRLVWDQWKNFISPSSSDDLKLTEPGIINSFSSDQLNSVQFFNVAGSLYDYMGQASINWSRQQGIYGGQDYYAVAPNDHYGLSAPLKRIYSASLPSDYAYSPLVYSGYPYAAYNMIWNEYFRDENLQPEAVFQLSCGYGPVTNNPGNFFVRRVNWEKDYFSSALPFVTQSIFATPTVQAGMSIEALREESALTRWLERQAVGGHRYQESILTHFGVSVPDEAAQIPVYLGGGKCPIQIGSVEQTSPFNDGTDASPLATLGGKGTGADSFHVDNVEFKEHGTVLGVMYIRPRALYADVNPKELFVRESRHDYYWPDFANLGDEAINTNELNPGFMNFVNSGGPQDFGYQMRYASYRTSFDKVHGQLRPTETLESWTQCRSWSDYTSAGFVQNVYPFAITSDFIQCKPSNRIFAVTEDEDNLVGEVTTFVDATRPMPNYVDPKLD